VNFANWCSNNYLTLNVKKTKELVIDFGQTTYEHKPLTINGEEIESVEEYKYLDTIIDHKLSWVQNTNRIHSQC